jgi:hypothetical protein
LLLSGGRKTYWTSSFSWMNRRGLPNTRWHMCEAGRAFQLQGESGHLKSSGGYK